MWRDQARRYRKCVEKRFMTIGFWNLDKKELSDLMIDFVIEWDIDLLFLAEATPETTAAFLRKSKSTIKGDGFRQIACRKDKVILLSRFNDTLFEDKSSLYQSQRMVAYKLKIPSVGALNIIGLHFHSKKNWSDISLAMECATLANNIAVVENNCACNDTILIGDFNMNPFESGMVAANGLHSVIDLDYAVGKSNGREIDNIHYPYFYNPMWNFFGDHKQPLGTYYNRASGNVSYEWHIFDQILIRPSLKKYLFNDYIKIVTRIGTKSLLNSLRRPDRSDCSDHLPITITLKL